MANVNVQPVNLFEKLKLFSDKWAPRVIAEMNDYQFKLVKVEGEFVWHKHTDTDETFLVIKGELEILFRDGKVDLKEGEMFVVPKAVDHKPVAKEECHFLLIEPKGLVNTGETENDFTSQNDVWV